MWPHFPRRRAVPDCLCKTRHIRIMLESITVASGRADDGHQSLLSMVTGPALRRAAVTSLTGQTVCLPEKVGKRQGQGGLSGGIGLGMRPIPCSFPFISLRLDICCKIVFTGLRDWRTFFFCIRPTLSAVMGYYSRSDGADKISSSRLRI